MAEIQEGNAAPRGGRPRQKKKSTRVDMTAMVDVAFLLLTFFILTTTMASPHAMEVNKSPLDAEGKPVAESKVLTMVLGAGDEVFYWEGSTDPQVEAVDLSAEEIRPVIQAHLNRHPNRCTAGVTSDCWDPIFVIKPGNQSRFKNLVDILDEMKINAVPKYALADYTPEDSVFLLRSLAYRY
jgi:biopolymer transport protein ExbD